MTADLSHIPDIPEVSRDPEEKIEINIDAMDMARYGFTPKLTASSISDHAMSMIAPVGRDFLETYLTTEFSIPTTVTLNPFGLAIKHPARIKPGRIRNAIHMGLQEPLRNSGLVAIYASTISEATEAAKKPPAPGSAPDVDAEPNTEAMEDFLSYLEMSLEDAEEPRPDDRLSHWLLDRARNNTYPATSYFLASPMDAFILELWAEARDISVVLPPPNSPDPVGLGLANLEWGRVAYTLLLEQCPGVIWGRALYRVSLHDPLLAIEAIEAKVWRQKQNDGYVPQTDDFVHLLTHPDQAIRAHPSLGFLKSLNTTIKR